MFTFLGFTLLLLVDTNYPALKNIASARTDVLGIQRYHHHFESCDGISIGRTVSGIYTHFRNYHISGIDTFGIISLITTLLIIISCNGQTVHMLYNHPMGNIVKKSGLRKLLTSKIGLMIAERVKIIEYSL